MKPFQKYWASLGLATAAVIVGFLFGTPALKQLGALALVATVASTPFMFLESTKRANAIRRVKRFGIGALVFSLIFFAAGELALRLWFWNGASFSMHGGPIVKRFERGFAFNRYDGPSRGPEISDQNRSDALRILVQGDSITWGQGVQNEEELYTTRLLSMLRQDNPNTEMAVLAKPGREIDSHLLQIAKWGQQLDPEIIIYQFYINDIELEKKGSRTVRLWQRPFFHHKLLRRSYLWFFLDYNLSQWFPSKNLANKSGLVLNRLTSESKAWQRSLSVFQAWGREAKRLTPKVLIVLYPTINSQGRPDPELLSTYDWFGRLCEKQGFEVLDLWQSFGDLQGDIKRIKSGIYDAHPSAEAHQRMAEGIYKRLLTDRWVDVGEKRAP